MIRLLFFLAICLTVVSCQKETDLNHSPIPPPGTNDSVYLDRIDVVENGDTSLAFSFVYDNLKRLLSMTELHGLVEFKTFEYYYTANDTLPYLMRAITNDPPYNDTTLTYRYYNAAGRTAKDSTIISRVSPPPGSTNVTTYVTQFSYAPSRIFSVTDVTSPFQTPSQDRDTSILDARGNILQTNTWRTINGITELNATSSFTYDDKPHPFTYMSNYQMHQVIPHGETLYFEYFPVNNILRQQETGGGFPWMDIISTYEYTSNGLPSKGTINDILQGESSVALFKYKPL